jgi:hypothetical protein
LTSKSIVAGNPKLNLAFVANLFNTYPGLEALEEGERPVIEDFDAEGEREARVFTLWLNSLNVEPGVYNLFEDLKVNHLSSLYSNPSLAHKLNFDIFIPFLTIIHRTGLSSYKLLIKSFLDV